MPVADAPLASSSRQGSHRPLRRAIATGVCLVLLCATGLTLSRMTVASASLPSAADAAWPAFAQTASDATPWLSTLHAPATPATTSRPPTSADWPAFGQTASDAGTWLTALRSFATVVTAVVNKPPVAPPAPTAHTVAAPRSAPPPPPPTTTTTPTTTSTGLPAPGQATAWGCDAALAYLSAYAAPRFTFECPGYAEGHQGMTCVNEPGVCPNEWLIAIAVPCPQAYMNEASNSWVAEGLSDAPIDPYGSCR